MSASGLRRAAGRIGYRLLFGVVPGSLAVIYGTVFLLRGPGRSDFWTFWSASRTVLHGGDPYPAIHTLPAVADKWFAPFVYPPVAAHLLMPLAVLPFVVAKVVYLLVNLGLVALALRLLGVRDRRCYAVALLSPPVIEAIGIGTISVPLLVLVAAAWRYRDRARIVGLCVAGAVTAKLFLWPLWFWLVRTKRYAAAAVAISVSAAAVIVSWSLIGFAGLRDYPTLLSRLTGLEGPHSYSLYALARALGAANASATRLVYVAGVVALACALRFVRDDSRSLVAMLGVAFVATPILWPHYLVLLVVPVALVSPTFSRLWLAPVLLWADATAWSHGAVWRIVGELALCAAIVTAGVRKRPEGSPHDAEIPLELALTSASR